MLRAIHVEGQLTDTIADAREAERMHAYKSSGLRASHSDHAMQLPRAAGLAFPARVRTVRSGQSRTQQSAPGPSAHREARPAVKFDCAARIVVLAGVCAVRWCQSRGVEGGGLMYRTMQCRVQPRINQRLAFDSPGIRRCETQSITRQSGGVRSGIARE